MKKILCLILAAVFMLLTGCQAKDSSKAYTTDELIQKIEKDKKNIKSDEDRENLVFVIKTISKSKTNLTALSARLNCFVEDTGLRYEVDYQLPFTDKITVNPVFPDPASDEYAEVTVSYDSQIDYTYNCKNKNWTIKTGK